MTTTGCPPSDTFLSYAKGPLMFTQQIISGHVTVRPQWPAVAGRGGHITKQLLFSKTAWSEWQQPDDVCVNVKMEQHDRSGQIMADRDADRR